MAKAAHTQPTLGQILPAGDGAKDISNLKLYCNDDPNCNRPQAQRVVSFVDVCCEMWDEIKSL